MSEGNVPKAVATGITAPRSADAVNPHRVGLVVGVLAAAVVTSLFAVRELPGRALALVGAPAGGVARYGGVVATLTPLPGETPKVSEDAEDADNDVRVSRDGERWVIELPRVTEANAPNVIARLSAGGGLEFREVIEGDAAAGLVKLGLAVEQHRGSSDDHAPTLEVDQWRPEDGGPTHTDLYIQAYAREQLVQAFADAQARGWTPPSHTKIVYQRIDPRDDAKDRRTAWRSYFVADQAALDGTAVANATGSYDPNTNRPVVMLEFTRAGARMLSPAQGGVPCPNPLNPLSKPTPAMTAR